MDAISVRDARRTIADFSKNSLQALATNCRISPLGQNDGWVFALHGLNRGNPGRVLVARGNVLFTMLTLWRHRLRGRFPTATG
jgi:hypothetical protein